jgi:uncharacterized protein
VTVSSSQPNLPDYGQLVKFLFQPFLSEPDAIGIHCEYTIDHHRIWVRVAFASGDQGSAFGRGGRNIQAIRTVIQAAATAVGQSIHLDVYGNNAGSRPEESDRSSEPSGNRPPRSAPNRRPPGDRSNGGDRASVPPPSRPHR